MANVSRRGFVGLIATSALLCGFGGVAEATSDESVLLRPPGGQDTALFAALCLRCDRCRSICPAGIVDVATLEDGVLATRTPILNYHRGYCDFCGKCQDVCPTGALGSFDTASDKIGIAIVRSDRCLAYSDGCTVCVDTCPFDAISLNDTERPIVDPDVCNGCGACEDACPALVYQTFQGGTRRGIKVVSLAEFEASGSVTTLSEGGDD